MRRRRFSIASLFPSLATPLANTAQGDATAKRRHAPKPGPSGRVSRWQAIRQRVFRTRPEDTLPMGIAHQRIYILPTGRGLAFLFSLLLMLIASINYALSLGYALCFLLTGLFAACLLHTYKNLAGLELTSIDSQPVFVGDNSRVVVSLANNGKADRFGISLNTAKAGTTVDCAVGDLESAILECPAVERGHVPVGRITLQSNYPLGLWRTWSYVHTEHVTLTYPKPEPNAPPLPIASIANQKGDVRRQSQQGELADLKQYQPGDSINTIAWKTAARGQGLFVRRFDHDSQAQTTHLSLQTTGATTLEQRLSRITAWVLAAERKGSAYSVELPGFKLAQGRGDAHAAKTLEALATTEQSP